MQHKNFKLTIEYNGAAYHGWQRQKDLNTVQGEIEKALKIITREDITITGSGRTDAGVHAWGQTCNFKCCTRLDADAFQRGLNSLLNHDIVISKACIVPLAFHARFDAVSKSYHYFILNRSLRAAVFNRYHWHISKKLDLGKMLRAVQFLKGKHDFKAFEGAGSPRADSVRHIFHADLVEMGDHFLRFEIKANGFLRFMVRNIMGTLVDVGRSRISAAKFGRVMASKNRCLAGPTAPAHGLYLVKVNYT